MHCIVLATQVGVASNLGGQATASHGGHLFGLIGSHIDHLDDVDVVTGAIRASRSTLEWPGCLASQGMHFMGISRALYRLENVLCEADGSALGEHDSRIRPRVEALTPRS